MSLGTYKTMSCSGENYCGQLTGTRIYWTSLSNLDWINQTLLSEQHNVFSSFLWSFLPFSHPNPYWNQIHVFRIMFFKVHSNIVLLFTHRPKGLFPVGLLVRISKALFNSGYMTCLYLSSKLNHPEYIR